MADVLDELDEEQRAAAMAVRGPVCIVAGAGTGKTRTVTHRLAHGVVSGQIDPGAALAVTHSKKAAAELAGRLHALGVATVDTRTFHAAGLRVARQFWERTGRSEPEPAVLSDREAWGIRRDSLRGAFGTDPDNSSIKDAFDEIGWARSRLVAADSYPAASHAAGRHAGIDVEAVVACWIRYEQIKTRLGRVDFADLLDIAAVLLETDEEVMRAVRARWAHVTVDEYQDTDPAQQRLLDAILGGNDDLCVVGDPRQAIYSWKGADPTYLTEFTRRYPTAQVFDLTRNYRSSRPILDWANTLARHEGARPLTTRRAAGPPPRIRRLDNELAEAAWVAGAARKAIASGTDPSEIAVLYRFNATQARFEAAFTRAGVPTVIAEDVTFFEREEIRSVLRPFGQAARRQPDADGLELVKSILERAGFDRNAPPPGLGAARSRWESHVALVELLEALPSTGRRDSAWLLSEVNGLARRVGDHGAAGATLATLHRAKGLEWDVVFVVGVTDGAVPSTFAQTPSEQAEEERLLHVGVTRARHELYLTWAAANARGWSNRPSPFLDFLPAAGPASGSARQRRSEGRKKRPRQHLPSDKVSSAACALCAEPLKGPSARRLGVCAACVTTAPGVLGRRARAIVQIAAEAARETEEDPAALVTPEGLLRLLSRQPESSGAACAVPGIRLTERWGALVVEILSG